MSANARLPTRWRKTKLGLDHEIRYWLTVKLMLLWDFATGAIDQEGKAKQGGDWRHRVILEERVVIRYCGGLP
jgi:hypothetical protein